ncbi:hypothetical protein GCK72_019335 [Caenorhabditis remanei]|uniref:Uncharacterized protein n=1 Tax=Caenorhabditis remanei TaxID=31234 RepID=A0A6A5GCF5_CAERE|nr:hypothetical protein GCK72_019335 [Caenorhabditis remanei]KAF1752780.1 hypothetical protein GCK72_019335 [Caenorhabditis remanei]
MFSPKLSLLILLVFVTIVACNFIESDVYRFPDNCEFEKSAEKREVDTSEEAVDFPDGVFAPSMESILEYAEQMAEKKMDPVTF